MQGKRWSAPIKPGPALPLHDRGRRHFSVTPTEFAFLQYLMERRGEAVSKQVLLKEVWELPDYDLDTRVADDLVKRLRRKFREAGCRAAIETVWGYGFRLEEDRGERS